MKRRWMGAALAATMISVTSPAWAQGTDFPTKEGAERFAEGNRLYTEGNFEGARLKFLQALAVARTPSLAMGWRGPTPTATNAPDFQGTL